MLLLAFFPFFPGPLELPSTTGFFSAFGGLPGFFKPLLLPPFCSPSAPFGGAIFPAAQTTNEKEPFECFRQSPTLFLSLARSLARALSLSPSRSRSLCSRLLSGARNKSDRVTDREQKRGNGRLGSRAGNEARIQTNRVSRHLRSLFPSLGPPPPAHHVGWMMMVCGRKKLFFVVFLSHS